MAVVVYDERLLDLVDEDVKVERIATGYVFTEGPVWHPRERHLTFSDVFDADGVMYRWSEKEGATIFRKPSEHANGNTYDQEGNLITCTHNRRVMKLSPDGNLDTLIDRFEDARLNSPNDVICTPNGNLIFTDPVFGLRQPDGTIVGQEYPYSGVFHYSPKDQSLKLLITNMVAPNGLAITGDSSILYVCDTREQTVSAWNTDGDSNMSNRRVVCVTKKDGQEGRPDGMKLDSLGNIYVAGNGPEGIWVFAPDGTLLGLIGTGEEMNRQGTAPGGPANLAWGDDDWQTIFATACSSVYRLRMKVPGQPVRFS
jgi:gluconolactonase